MNKRRLREFALVAEIFGGVAVVVTLIFLVLETSKNTNAIHAETYRALTSEINQFRRDERESDVAEIRSKFLNDGRQSLTETEMRRYYSLEASLWGVYESAYYALERGVLGENEWARFISQICRRYSTVDEPLWYVEDQASLSLSITPIFRDYVERSCSEKP